MRVCVGAPVCQRAWALPRWFECLHEQTRKPDSFEFVHTEADRDDGTWHQLLAGAGSIPCHVVEGRSGKHVPRMEREKAGRIPVYEAFSGWRNQLLDQVAASGADVFISLDTDVMFEDPFTIERLVRMLEVVPVAAPVTFLHPWGERSECYNAGFWRDGDHERDPQRAWARVTKADTLDPTKVLRGFVLPVDIPMAAVAMRREVFSCRYRYHECGEDLGFAQDLDVFGHRCFLDTRVFARHVWEPTAL